MQNHSLARQREARRRRNAIRQARALLLGLLALVYGPILFCSLYMLALHQWIPALAILLGLAIMTVPSGVYALHAMNPRK